MGAVLLVNGAFALNNLAPYLGLNYVAPMTMYSNLAGSGENHFLLPSLALSDAGEYVSLVRVVSRNADTPPVRAFRSFAAWTVQSGRLVNLDFVRYHASRMCASTPDASIRLMLQTSAGAARDYPNVCAEPSMLQFQALSGYPVCEPLHCKTNLRRWARTRAWADQP